MTAGRSQVVAEDALARARSVLCPALRAAVDALPEPVCRVAGYQWGWRDPGAVGGELVHGAVVMLAAEAASAGRADGVAGAVAVELVRLFAVLREDAVGEVRRRWGRPAAWVEFGAAQVLLAGDGLVNEAVRALVRQEARLAVGQVRLLGAAVAGLVAEWSADGEPVDYVRYRETVARGSGELVAAAAGLGGLAGGAGPEQVAHLLAFGRHLGTALRYVDDLLGVWGDPGGEVRRASLPMVLASGSDSPAARDLANADPALLEAAGVRDRTRQHAQHELTTALTHLRAAKLPGSSTALRDLATHLIDRAP